MKTFTITFIKHFDGMTLDAYAGRQSPVVNQRCEVAQIAKRFEPEVGGFAFYDEESNRIAWFYDVASVQVVPQ